MSFSDVFSFLGWIAVAAGIALMLLTPLLKRLMSDRDESNEQVIKEDTLETVLS